MAVADAESFSPQLSCDVIYDGQSYSGGYGLSCSSSDSVPVKNQEKLNEYAVLVAMVLY